MDKKESSTILTGGSDTTYGKLMKEYRLKAGYSLDEFAKIIGKSKRTLQNYEAGITTVPHNLRSIIEEKLHFNVVKIHHGFFPRPALTGDELFIEYVHVSGIATIEKIETDLYFVQRPNEKKYRVLTAAEFYTLISQVGNFITKMIEMYPLLPERDDEDT